MSKRHRRSDGLPSLDRKSVHILGSRLFQNALLANVITAATGVACHLCPSREALPEPPPADRWQHLVLEDYLSLGNQGFDASLTREAVTASLYTLVSLFNLPDGWGREGIALRHGLRGFFYESDVPETLIKGVRHIFAGELWVSRKVMAHSFEELESPLAAQNALPAGLTPRETETLRLVAEGASNATVAERMCISAHTVKTHIYNAYRKTGVENRIQAARWAAKNLV
jgi:LuxR family transcriptional regulator, positive regulator of biofilm formation